MSKEQEREIVEFKRYVKENPTLINASDKRFGIPINYAVINNYPFLLKWVIRQNADVNVRNHQGKSPLHESVIWDHTENQETKLLLIKSGADVNSADDYGNTPLHTAASFGKIGVAKLLISHGAKVGARAKRGETPLHYAARQPFDSNEDRIGIARVLLQFGAEIDEKDNHGITALHQAAMVGNFEMTEFLLKEGANPNSLTSSGDSPLHIASASGYSKVAELLLQRGANVNQRDNKGATPLNRALNSPAIHYEAGKKEHVDTSAAVQVLRQHRGSE